MLSNNTAPNFTDQNYIAAGQGQVMILPLTTGSFSPDLNTLVLLAMLPADYASEPNTLFVRLWQAEVPFASGQSVQLDDGTRSRRDGHGDDADLGITEARPNLDHPSLAAQHLAYKPLELRRAQTP